MRRLILALCVVAALALSACGGSGGSDGSDCLVLANGGNKVCGADAAAWCQSTDGFRSGSTAPSVTQTQADCDTIEAEYSSTP